ncbi:MAG: TPM domain-containing protein [Pseudomonadota bacterium]
MRGLVVILTLLAAPLFAQSKALPNYESTFVNDYADIMDQGTEARVTSVLEQLRTETGVEMTVLTIGSRDTYSDLPSIEAFATALFNDWGIGDATRNDGILVLVARDDRELRIELGAGYDPVYDGRMLRVIDTIFVPAFERGAFAEGIENGVDAIIERLDPAWEDPSSGANWDQYKDYGVFAAFILLFIGMASRKKISDGATRLKRCPNCRRRSLSRARTVINPSTVHAQGEEHLLTRCSRCSFQSDERRVIPRRKSKRNSRGGGGGFGDGRSSGGGASGRW